MALLRKLSLLALVPVLAAPFALVGCAEETAAPASTAAAETGEDVGEATEDGTGSANDWQHQASFNLSCTEAVTSSFTNKSRRQYFSVAGTKGQQASFSFDGGWTPSWGARAYVTDVTGKVIGTATNTKDNAVSVSVTFPADGKYFVYVSASNYKAIKKDYKYTLTEICAQPAKPYCGTVRVTQNVSSPTFYAQEFNDKKSADAWVKTFPSGDKIVSEGECSLRPCTKIFKPVCGVIKSGEPTTYGNFCMAESAIVADAGNDASGASKGFYTEGACAPKCDYTSPTKHYVVKDREQCKLVKYRCSPGQNGFADDCGCGCEDAKLAQLANRPNGAEDAPEGCSRGRGSSRPLWRLWRPGYRRSVADSADSQLDGAWWVGENPAALFWPPGR